MDGKDEGGAKWNCQRAQGEGEGEAGSRPELVKALEARKSSEQGRRSSPKFGVRETERRRAEEGKAQGSSRSLRYEKGEKIGN